MSRTLTVYLAADLKRFSGGMKDAERQASGFGGTLKNVLGPALIGAGVAAGAFAAKLAIDGVQAAIEDEKAVAQLANTLGNLNLAHDTTAVEQYIYELERAYGVADTELRPAYDRLVRSTKDTDEANRALKIAMDISASTGKDLRTVVDTLGRAYDGSTTSLSRLGVGLDQTQLAAMGVDEIMTTLAQNFSGAADAAAETLEGRLARLTTATDNLKEAFGAGLLQAIQDTNGETQQLVDQMETAESSIKVAGYNIGQAFKQATLEASELSVLLGVISNPGATWNYIFEDIAIDLRGLGDEAAYAAREANRLRYELEVMPSDFERGTFAGGDFAETYNTINFELKAANENYRDAAVNAARLANETSSATENTRDLSRATGGRGGATEATQGLTKAQRLLIDEYELAGIAFQTTKGELIAQIGVLEEATRAVEDYANSIQQDLLSGFDLGGLAEANLDEQGKLNAESFFKGFDDAINQAEWFGNVLNELKARNVDTQLIAQIAGLGPAVGGALAQNLIEGDGALLQTFTDKWSEVQRITREAALGLVPEYLEAGRLSAIENLNGLAEQFAADQKKFKRLGNKLGQQVGDEFSKRMLKEVAAAVKEVEAIATAARAERVAAAQAEQARLTEQAVAVALGQLIRNSDQRAGKAVEPVLQ